MGMMGRSDSIGGGGIGGGIGGGGGGGVGFGSAAAPAEPLRLLDDPERGTTVIERLSDAPVESRETLDRLLREVEARRQVGATGMNAESSRSHQIVRLTIESREVVNNAGGGGGGKRGDSGDGGGEGRGSGGDAVKCASGQQKQEQEEKRALTNQQQRQTGPVLTATLNFVDLAGSERASRTQSSGTRLKEGCHINRS